MYERIHPQSYRELTQLVKLHGAPRVLEAVREIERKLAFMTEDMPWCTHCGSYHHHTAPHIQRIKSCGEPGCSICDPEE